MRTMSLDQIRVAAPSAFATKPYAAMSEKYRFFETSHVVEALMHEGFAVVRAQQSRTRIEGSSSYHLSLGLYRVVCLNGLVVKSAGIEDIRVRHTHIPHPVPHF